jgi:hypothetical protein
MTTAINARDGDGSKPVDKVRLNLEKFVWSSRRKIAKEKSKNSDAMRTLKDAVEGDEGGAKFGRGGGRKWRFSPRGGQDALYPALSGEWEVPVTRKR